jgi:hypothetical protein
MVPDVAFIKAMRSEALTEARLDPASTGSLERAVESAVSLPAPSWLALAPSGRHSSSMD